MSGHTPGSRCRKCSWVHEADDKAGTSFMGVELCALHAAAPEMLLALKNAGIALRFYEAYMKTHNNDPGVNNTTYPFGQDTEREIIAVLAKAEGK